MTELALDVDRRLALLEQERRKAVPEAMRREVRWQVGGFEDALERGADLLVVIERSHR